MFPNPCPSVAVEDVTTDLPSIRGTQSYQINPLLSPSLQFVEDKYPDFFEKDDKYLLFSLGSGAVRDVAAEENLNTTDIVSLNVPREKDNFGEPLMTYIVSTLLREKGFIVGFSEMQLKTRGFPDLYAFKFPDVQNTLMDNGVVEGGFYLNELELDMAREETTKVQEEKTAVIEMKRQGGFYNGKDQVQKYLNCKCYNGGYIGVPFADVRIHEWKERGDLDVGAITVDDEGKVKFTECPMDYGKSERVVEVKEIIKRILKLTLLKNLSLKEVCEVFPSANSFSDLYYAVDEIDMGEVLSFI